MLYTEEVTYRDDVTLEYVPDAETGHQNDWFTGWYLSPALAASGTPLAGFRMPSDDVSVYAGWTPADRTVQFDVRADDAVITGVPADQSVRAGECAEKPDDPERAGYIFLGWFEEPSGKAGDAEGGIPDTRAVWDFGRPVENDLTLYAGWIPERDTSYTIRHVDAESGEPFYEEMGTGNSGTGLSYSRWIRQILCIRPTQKRTRRIGLRYLGKNNRRIFIPSYIKRKM